VHNKSNRLGRGLEALIPRSMLLSGKTVINIPLTEIRPSPYQPRTNFNPEAIEGLSNSIKQHGVAQPILVRKLDGHYELIAGERRYRASIMAEMETIPAIVRNISDRESLQLALIENLSREDLNPIEEARGYVRLIEEFSLTHQGLAEIFGKNRSTVTNTMRLLKLPRIVQRAICNGEISEGHARTLLALKTDSEILEKFGQIVSKGMNVRQIEDCIAIVKKKARGEGDDTQISLFGDIEKKMGEKYSVKVMIKGSKKRGRIIIPYTSEKQFKELSNKLSAE
jgi:ParB family transcriptional regulator, chromosome partitioning protein